MARKFTLNRRFALYDVSGEALCFVSEAGIQTLPGSEWLPLLEQLVGNFSLQEIQARLEERIPPARTSMMIRLLLNLSIVVEAGGEESTAAPGASEAHVGVSTNIQAALVAVGRSDLGPARELLTLGGIRCADEATLQLVLTDDYMSPELEEINRRRLAEGRPWLLAKVEGERAWIGPLFVPGEGPCWECFAARWRERDQSRQFLNRVANRGDLIVPPLTTTAATRLAALAGIPEILERFVRTGSAGATAHTIRTLDFSEGSWRDHRLVRRPQCAACGDPKVAIPQRISLERAEDALSGDDAAPLKGSSQVTALLSTWQRLEHHISPVTGFVDTLTAHRTEELAHCFSSTRFDMRPVGRPIDLLAPRNHTDWGKGFDPLQAKVSALAEAVERFSLMADRPPDAIRAPLSALGDRAVDPRMLLHFSDLQMRGPSAGDPNVAHFERVPRERFDPEQEIGWTAGLCLTDQRPCLVASDYCWISGPAARDAHFCFADTNGCAAGPDLTHAIRKGLFELVERDSVALWWYNMIPRPGVNITSFGDDQVMAICEDHRKRWGRDVWVLDITSDIGIPVFAAVSARPDDDRPEFVFGFGCDADPTLALRGAILELYQLFAVQLPFLTTANHVDPWKANRQVIPVQIEGWLRRTRRAEQPHLLPAPQQPAKHCEDYVNGLTSEHRGSLARCVDHLRTLDIKVYAVDVTRPDLGLPVARVLAPGLRHFWRQLGPGRLYDTPVAMGWMDHPLAEHQLNPISMFA